MSSISRPASSSLIPVCLPVDPPTFFAGVRLHLHYRRSAASAPPKQKEPLNLNFCCRVFLLASPWSPEPLLRPPHWRPRYVKPAQPPPRRSRDWPRQAWSDRSGETKCRRDKMCYRMPHRPWPRHQPKPRSRRLRATVETACTSEFKTAESA